MSTQKRETAEVFKGGKTLWKKNTLIQRGQSCTCGGGGENLVPFPTTAKKSKPLQGGRK